MLSRQSSALMSGIAVALPNANTHKASGRLRLSSISFIGRRPEPSQSLGDGRAVHHHFASLHYPTDIPDDHADVLQRIAFDRDDVRKIPGCDGSQALLHSQ